MAQMAGNTGKMAKLGLGALALAVMSVPAVSAFATASDPSAELTAEQVETNRQIFADWSCGVCHALEDAGGTGHIGPAFDGNGALDHAYVVDRITNGQGAMPAFGGQLTDEEIDQLATYIIQAKQ